MRAKIQREFLAHDPCLHSLTSHSAAYARFHPERFLSTVLDSEAYIGDLDLDSIPKEKVQETDEEQRIRIAQSTKPPLAAMINLNDFEVRALI